MKNEIIDELGKGNDTPLRAFMSGEILKVIHKSTNGEIGWSEYIQEVEEVLENGKTLASNWKE